MSSTPERSSDAPGALTWTFALLGGLAAWFLRLVVGVGMVGWACDAGTLGVVALLAVAAVCAAVALASLRTAWRLRHRTEALDLVAVVGLLLGLVGLAGIVFESGTALFVDPCLSAT